MTTFIKLISELFITIKPIKISEYNCIYYKEILSFIIVTRLCNKHYATSCVLYFIILFSQIYTYSTSITLKLRLNTSCFFSNINYS